MTKKKRVLSDEQKAKMSANLAKARAARIAKKAEERTEPLQAFQPEIVPAPEPTPAPETPAAPVDANTLLLQRLMAEIDELKKQKNPDMTPEAALQYTAQMAGQPTVGRNGIQGKMFRYPVEKSYYPDPTDRLYDDPKLVRHNLRLNYFFDWEVEGVEYEKYGVTYAEPKFTVRLFRRLFEDDGITPNGRMALINRQIQHEDEVVARAAADKLGLTESFATFEEMMNEMRFLRIQTWLHELFSPVKVEQHNRKPTQQVIDGKVVEVYDTETLIDGSVGHDKAQAIQSSTRF